MPILEPRFWPTLDKISRIFFFWTSCVLIFNSEANPFNPLPPKWPFSDSWSENLEPRFWPNLNIFSNFFFTKIKVNPLGVLLFRRDPDLLVKKIFLAMFLFCLIFAETQIFNFNPETQFFGDKFTVRLSYAHLRPKKPFYT